MSIRPLRPEELAEVEKVFGPGLNVSAVRVNEGSPLPNWIGRVGAFFRRTAPPALNAITIANTCYFPIELMTHQPQHAYWLRDMGDYATLGLTLGFHLPSNGAGSPR